MYRGLLRLWTVFLLSGLFVSTATRADNGAQVYTGTLGKSPIVLEINPRTGEGRYFYKKYRKDLPLDGSLDGDTLELQEGSSMEESRSTLRLQPTTHGWSGEWTSTAGKTLKINLEPAVIPDVPADALPFLARLHDKYPYEYLRLQGITLKKGKTDTFMGYTLQWWSEPHTGTSLFEVVSGYSLEERRSINQQLMARLWSEVLSSYGCSGSYAQSSQPLWMSPTVMSVRISSDYYCGGAYPDQNNDALNFDTQSGKLLTLDDVLWVGQSKPLHFEQQRDFDEGSSTSSDAWSNYRTTELAPWLVAQLLKLYPSEMTVTAEGENDCNYDEKDPWQFPGWYFTEQGTKLEPSFAHVAAVCGFVDWSVLPYAVVKQHPGAVNLQLSKD
ncbi:hypothetical protein KVQ82_08210 [Pseudomonas sp. AO-1]|uniref:hypothetical protein n=1 Tax=Pseudomonas sp. AO-1 TaxID=2855434 RepID=UPI001C777508|nr:hypothetical protein [Pseudomonas sp. AO-1]QXZ15884.1 hypothetical protein KVQ82_08210 [Pseudomonas sp. AO-1]